MKTKAKLKRPEVVLKDGRPSAVIIDIDDYFEMLEKLEDVEDIKALAAMRKKPLKFRNLDDFLKDRGQHA
jgi:PHD/YefM family antitoxin component YafN of YafNO toxin-antitoxin module